MSEHMTDDLRQLAKSWLDAKAAEYAAIYIRRKLEDRMKSLIGISENLDGTETATPEGYTIKVVGRITRSVDAERVQELAAEHGLTEHLSSLFRWKPEVNLTAWKAADPSITAPLAGAITAKPGRPSFTITIEEN